MKRNSTNNKTRGEFTHGSLSIDGNKVCNTLENANALVPSGDYVISLIKCKQYSRKMPLLAPEPVEGNLNPEVCDSASTMSSSLEHCRAQADSSEAQSWNLKLRCMQCKRLSFVCNNTTLPSWCPMLKPGNGIHSRLDGSILVGKYHCVNCLLHPKTTFDPLYERIRKSISRGNQVLLSIS